MCNSPFYINDICRKWDCDEGKTRYACNYSYGYGGTNTFVILREANEPGKCNKSEREELFILTAKTKKSLDENIKSYISFLSNAENRNLTEICYNASTRRILFEDYRLAVIARDSVDLLSKLKSFQIDGYCDGVFYGEKNNIHTDKPRYESTVGKDRLTIAKDFTDGINFKFSELFSDLNLGFCELPRYVFDKERCWCENRAKQRGMYLG